MMRILLFLIAGLLTTLASEANPTLHMLYGKVEYLHMKAPRTAWLHLGKTEAIAKEQIATWQADPTAFSAIVRSSYRNFVYFMPDFATLQHPGQPDQLIAYYGEQELVPTSDVQTAKLLEVTSVYVWNRVRTNITAEDSWTQELPSTAIESMSCDVCAFQLYATEQNAFIALQCKQLRELLKEYEALIIYNQEADIVTEEGHLRSNAVERSIERQIALLKAHKVLVVEECSIS